MCCFISDSANPVSHEALSATYVYVHVNSMHVLDVHMYLVHTMSTCRVLQCTYIISPPVNVFFMLDLLDSISLIS